jgi:serine/threonine protein kinase
MCVATSVHMLLVLITIISVHLERLGSLPEDTVRFYVAQISSALMFLHKSRIMHRYVFDVSQTLKPELSKRLLKRCQARQPAAR